MTHAALPLAHRPRRAPVGARPAPEPRSGAARTALLSVPLLVWTQLAPGAFVALAVALVAVA